MRSIKIIPNVVFAILAFIVSPQAFHPSPLAGHLKTNETAVHGVVFDDARWVRSLDAETVQRTAIHIARARITYNGGAFTSFAVDNEGGDQAAHAERHLYRTTIFGRYVTSKPGHNPGLIPTLSRPGTLAFEGAYKNILYARRTSAAGPDDRFRITTARIRNTARIFDAPQILISAFAVRPRQAV